MKLVFITILFLFSIEQVLAQSSSSAVMPTTNSTSEEVSLWDKLKKMPIGMAVTNEIMANTETTSVTGVTNATDVIFTYKITNKNALTLTSGMSLTDSRDADATTSYNGTTLIFSRSGLLNQDKHGINLSANIRYKALPGGTEIPGSGSLRVRTSRTFNPMFSLLAEGRWEQYIRQSSTPDLSRGKFTFILGPTYQITEKFGFSPTVVFSESLKGEDTPDPNYVNFAPSLDYSITPEVFASLYWDTYPFATGDGSFIAPRWYSQGGIGFYLSYSIL